jgi:hypothetical protein
LQLLGWGWLPSQRIMVSAHDKMLHTAHVALRHVREPMLGCIVQDGQLHTSSGQGACISCDVLALIGWFLLCSMGERIMQRCRHLVGVCAPFWRKRPCPVLTACTGNGAGMHRAGQPVYWQRKEIRPSSSCAGLAVVGSGICIDTVAATDPGLDRAPATWHGLMPAGWLLHVGQQHQHADGQGRRRQ